MNMETKSMFELNESRKQEHGKFRLVAIINHKTKQSHKPTKEKKTV